jgi:hypothetical protein
MNQIAGQQDGWKLLEAIGFTKDRSITKAVIVIEIGRPVIVRVREYAKPFRVVGDALEEMSTKYELVERKSPEAKVYHSLITGRK